MSQKIQSNRFPPFTVNILPRKSMSWDEFISKTPPRSIALDGIVQGGPNYNETTVHINFDHHNNVVREATMSTAMQVFFAIKGGLSEALTIEGQIEANIYINDTDQDTALAVWLLLNYKKFEGTQSIPHINRLLALNDRWDITGGAFPMNLDDNLVRQHAWVFRPYTDLRKSGGLAEATPEVMFDNLETVIARLNCYLMGQGEKADLDTRYNILYESPSFKIVDEIGGNEARYHLFSKGILNAFVSLIAHRPDGRFVYTIGRRSRFIPFPVTKLYDDFNIAEGLTNTGWNGSDIIGGSPRENGSGLSWKELRDIIIKRLDQK